MEAQIQQAVEIASGYSNNNSLKQQALQFIQQFKSSTDGWKHCLTILNSATVGSDSISLNLKFFIFQVFDERVPTLSDDEKIVLKDAVYSYLKYIITKGTIEPVFLRNAVAKTLGLLFVHCTLTCYPTIIKDLLGMASQADGIFNALATDYYVKTLVIIHQEIGDQMIIKDKNDIQRSSLLKDHIRDNEMIDMVRSWRQALGHFSSPETVDSSNDIETKALFREIVIGILTAIGFYSSWIEINLILDQEFLSLFYRCLTSDDSKIQIEATNTFINILHKKMPPAKKLELITFLHLGSFLNQMQLDVKNVKFEFAQALARLCRELGIECVQVLEKSSHEELKYDQFRNTCISKILEIMPLIFKFLENEYDDLSLEVFPFIGAYLLFLERNLVNEDLDFSALDNDQILTSLLNKIILKMRYDDSDDGDDEESIELFNDVRSKLASFQDSIVVINDTLSLDVMIESINTFLFHHLDRGDNKISNWRDIELGLYQLNYYSEMLRNNKMNLPKTMINSSRPYFVFNEMLCKIVDNSTIILVSHPLIQLLFFELIMKHYTFFTNSNIQVEGVNKNETLLKVLKIFVSNFGVFSENPKVKFRTWYLFYRFIKLTRPQVDDYVIIELVKSVTTLLDFDFSITANKNNSDLHDVDLTLVEESGSFENQMYLFEAIGILVTLTNDENKGTIVLQGVLQPLFSNLEKCINAIDNINLELLLQAHHSLLLIGTLVKGVEGIRANQLTDKFVGILEQISQVVLITLERFDDYNVVREACSFCLVRLLSLLSKLDTEHSSMLQDISSKYFTITMNGFEKRKMPEVSNFLNFVSQIFHFCGKSEPVYGLLASLLAPLVHKVVAFINQSTENIGDDITKRDILELQRSFISFLTSVSSDNMDSIWIVNDTNKHALIAVINLMLSYSCSYLENDISLVKAALTELIALNNSLGTGQVWHENDTFKNDNNVFEKADEILVGNSFLVCIELTFKIRDKHVLKDAQFRNGVLLEVTRLMRTISFAGNYVPDANTLRRENAKTKGANEQTNGNDSVSIQNASTCQQMANILISQVGFTPSDAEEFVHRLSQATDRNFTKYMLSLIN